MTKEIAQELETLASEQLERIEGLLPRDPMARAALFIEATRVVDAYTVNPPEDDGSGYGLVNDTIIKWGWNPAAALLLSPLPVEGAFPLAKSTTETRSSARDLLRGLGCNVLLRRAAQMVRSGIAKAQREEGGYVLKSAEGMTSALLDNLDTALLDGMHDHGAGGGFLDQWRREDIDELMLPLMRPWRTSRGTMLAYDAILEVDNHFLAEALELATRWRVEAGMHPETRLGGVTGAELTQFATFFASFHLKHAKFVALAARHVPEVSPIQSLTIWKPRAEFVSGIADFTGLQLERVSTIVRAIAFRADEARTLRYETTPLHPLLIDLGNGLDLWPVSALGRNPFETVRRIQQWRDPSAVARLAAPREGWLRDDIYALFEGNRYERVEGNIKVKVGGRILTDIDAAVYDRVGDQLALFQIKWQDFSTNSPKELKSKATNFMDAMNLWSGTVEDWYRLIGVERLLQKLRLRPSSRSGRTTVFLFGISRSMARLGAMACRKRARGLALANWAQFVRARLEVGPADQVFSKLHARLVEEFEMLPLAIPLPITVEVAGCHIHFQDHFFRTGSDDKDRPPERARQP